MKKINDKFTVAVIATMSSGKSTILNALLGYELLPSKNEACTAKTFKIKDVDGLAQFIGRTKDVEEVKHLIFTNKVVSIIGDGGIGKTALAIKVVYDKH